MEQVKEHLRVFLCNLALIHFCLHAFLGGLCLLGDQLDAFDFVFLALYFAVKWKATTHLALELYLPVILHAVEEATVAFRVTRLRSLPGSVKQRLWVALRKLTDFDGGNVCQVRNPRSLRP